MPAKGATVFLGGRTLAKLDAVAKAGGIDIALNAVGLFHVQGA